MIDEQKKLNALMHFTSLVQQHPGMVFLTGYLAGQISRVHFVEDVQGAPIVIRLTARRFPLISKPPYMANVNGVSIPDPVSLVTALSQNDEEIAVQLDVDPKQFEEWYQDVTVSSIHSAHLEEENIQEELDSLHVQIDRALDIYNECRKILREMEEHQDQNPDQSRRMEAFLRMAREDIRRLSRRMQDLNTEMELEE